MKFYINIIILLFPISSLALNGTVSNNRGDVVPDASLVFTNVNDTSIVFTATTDVNGNYQISIPMGFSESADGFELYNNYPNPFSGETVIPFSIDESGEVDIIITNAQGQRIAYVYSGHTKAGLHQIVWDGKLTNGRSISAGIYYYTIFYNGFSSTKRMVIMDGQHSYASPVPINISEENGNNNDNNLVFDISIQAPQHRTLQLSSVNLAGKDIMDFIIGYLSPVPYATVGNYLGIEVDDGVYEPFYLNGVNLGVSLPGTWPGELAATRDHYQRWLNDIGEMGFNSIRTYTLHFPRFYEELAYYNQQNPDRPLYLFQGVWLDEVAGNYNLFDQTEKFDYDIEEVIDCMHGNRVIDERFGRAYGNFDTDISQWIMGYIIGREVHPEEVLLTDSLNSDFTSYHGESISIVNANPSEAWFTNRVDHLITYERNTYGVERPVSQSSWPTLDPLSHPTEQPGSTEDTASIDMTKIDLHNAPAGYFASYHAYPYFPDYISEDPNYITYSDEYGPNSYVGYLTALKNHYADIPLVIAEFGVPSSWGNAHDSHSGMSHGGQDETQQGIDNVRLMKNIHSTNCGGGFLFAWIDEWFKACWITDPISSTIDRRPFWHNITSAEENFGLITFDVPEPQFNTWTPVNTPGGCKITEVSADYDNQFFHLKLEMSQSLSSGDTIWIAYDTYRSDLGESILPNNAVVNNRAEFALELTKNNAQLYVTQAYDLFAIWFGTSPPEQLFRSIPTDGEPWNPVRWKNNHWEDAIDEIGNLVIRNTGQEGTSKDAVIFDGNSIHIRIPWTLLHYIDPGLREVMHDNRDTPERETLTSDGISLSIFFEDCFIETQRFVWDKWYDAPETFERYKESFHIVKDALLNIEFNPIVE